MITVNQQEYDNYTDLPLGSIDRNRKPVKPQIFLALPNRTIIAKLSEAYGIKYYQKLGKINELTFQLPYYIDVGHQHVENPNIDKCRDRYCIKVSLGHQTEWFRIQSCEDGLAEDSHYKSFSAYSLGIELNDRMLLAYKAESYHLRELLEGKLGGLPGLLADTGWTTGYVDSDFLLKYRSYSFDTKRVLDAVNDVAEIFNALIIWDTNQRKIHLYNPERIGQNRGLTFSYYKYLKSLTHKNDMGNLVTRLKVFGKDGLSINRVNPSGTNFLEDYSFFMYPFERDHNKTVLQSSYYMSDGLCHALLDYRAVIEQNTGNYRTMLVEKEAAQIQLTERQTELIQLETDLETIRDNIYLAQTSGSNASEYQQAFALKEQEIRDKQDQIAVVNAELDVIESKIAQLRSQLATTNHFTTAQLDELHPYVIEESWIESNHIDDQKLYDDAKGKLQELRLPKPVINIDIVNFLEVIEEQWNWDKLNLGDTVTIKHEIINLQVKAKIIEIEYDYESLDIRLTIANVRAINDDRQQFIDLWKNSISTSNSLLMNRFRWDGVETELGYVGNVIKQFWNDTKQEIDMAVNQNVIIDRRGITIIDPGDPLKFLRATNGVLALTNDGGNTFRSAITPDKIVAEELMGMIISGERVIVSDPDGILVINGNKMTISNRDYTEVMKLGLIATGQPRCNGSTDRFGMQLENSRNRITIDDCNGFTIDRKQGVNYVTMAQLDTDGILVLNGIKMQQSMISHLSGTLTNGIEITPTEGIVVTRSDNNVRVTLNATDGIRIQRKESGDWQNKLYADTYGVLHVEDLVATRIRIRDGDGHILIDAESKFLNLNEFDTIVGNIAAENITAKLITADEGFISELTVNHLKTLDKNSESGVRNYIDIKNHTAQWITGTSTGVATHATSRNGELLYWSDVNRTSITTVDTGIPAMSYAYDELVKMKIYFESNDPTNYPIIEMGAGGQGNLQKAFIFKDNDGLKIQYFTSATAGSHERSIRMVNNGIFIDYNNEVRNVPIGLAIAGAGSFKSPVTFSGGVKLPNTNYSVIITPNADPQGYIGEWWIANRTTTGFTIDNSGSATTTFDYAVVMHNS